MLRLLSVLVGLGLIVLGVAGYLPDYMENGLLFGYFEVDSMHNVIHITTGVIALLSGVSAKLSKTFLLMFGLAYTVAAILGFWREGDIFVMHMNGADNLLNLALGVVMLLFGVSCSAD